MPPAPTLPKGPPVFDKLPRLRTPIAEFGWTIIAAGITIQYPVRSYLEMNDDECRVEVFNEPGALIGICIYEHFVAFFQIESKATGVTIHAPRRSQ